MVYNKQRRLAFLRTCLADSVVPSPSIAAGGGDGVLASMYGVEVGSADNATYCQGIQPITIEPMDCETDMDDVEPLTYAESAPAGTSAARRNTPDIDRRPGADGAAPFVSPMRVVYCGTLSGDQLLQQGALGDLARNLSGAGNGSAPPASNISEPHGSGRNALLDSTPGQRPSAGVPADSGMADSSTSECSVRKAATVQQPRRSSDKPSPRPAQQPVQSTTDSSNSGSSTGRKSAAGTKSRRAQSLDGKTSAAQQHR